MPYAAECILLFVPDEPHILMFYVFDELFGGRCLCIRNKEPAKINGAGLENVS